ncbi:helix-turn-helix transcriptional regulator [Actinospica durhamensis]|uniref:Helix-turn-helix transcriptional regulator n=1 Tax=Actinospica durhamensis TaxID=1508375 RepID=A0A941EWW6_9ACTN|nr:helix-turn-helix transcriptional regulator [Actinospica durhamensis]MBR7837817.1 helix-turn-helix transcriptional regulator [Actinospica durhamensis]
MDSFYVQLGNRIRRARLAAGLSQEQLGQRVGLNRSSISNVEKGTQRILAHTLVEFATALDILPIQLLEQAATEPDVLEGLSEEHRSFVEGILADAGEGPRG